MPKQTHNLEVPGSSPGWSTQLVSCLSFGKRLIFFSVPGKWDFWSLGGLCAARWQRI